MSAPEAELVPLARGGRQTIEFGTIVVVGGGCYGSYYVRQLGRAEAAGAVRWRRLLVVDRDPTCRVARGAGGPPDKNDTAVDPGARHRSPAPDIVIDEWGAFFDRHLADGARAPAECVRDAIVPSPLMPHLMYQWLVARARARWPHRVVSTIPLQRAPSVPWRRAAEDGTHYVSFATWMCPVNCVEPDRCPHTRGARSWSLPPALRDYAAAMRQTGEAMDGPIIFHCVHRAYGVGMVDTADVLAADREVERLGTAGAVSVLIGTVSHCHGALNVLSIGS